MSRIKRRQFLQFAESTLATVGMSQLDIIHQDDRYARVLAQSTPRKLALLVVCGGCAWRSCCHTIFLLGKRSIIISALWRTAGVWQQMNQALREMLRRRAGRESTPSAAIVEAPVSEDN